MERKLDCIILVDDDNATNFLHHRVIKNVIDVSHLYVFQKANEALDFLVDYYKNNNTHPELLLLDINMPVMDGWEFLEAYQKLYKELPSDMLVYMLSTSLNPDDKAKAENILGSECFMSKPLTESMIAAVYDKHFK